MVVFYNLENHMYSSRFVTIVFFICSFFCLKGQSIIVQPYLQNASSSSITIMWEASSCIQGSIHWGVSNSTDSTLLATSLPSQGGACIYTAALSGLLPNTKYFYNVSVGSVVSSTFHFITPPTNHSETSFNLVAMSDMQRDNSNPTKFKQIVNDGILDFISSTFSTSVNEHLQMVLIPGDLVDNGNNHEEWVNEFFKPSKNLFSYVPFYPVPEIMKVMLIFL